MHHSTPTRFILLLLLLFVFLETKAQSDFRPGHIVTLQDDTIKGFINYRRDAANAKNCIFKKDPDQEKVTYTPDQIKSYRFDDGNYYITSNSLDFEFKNQVFVEYVIKGSSASIFYYKDEAKDHYLILKDTVLLELMRPQLYKRQLKFLMQDQPDLSTKIDRMACSTKDLIALVKEYEQLSSSSQGNLQFEKKTPKDVTTKVGVFFSGGLSQLSPPPYDMYKSDYDETKSLDFAPSFTYGIGATVNFHLNFIGENKYILELAPALNFVKYSSYTERPLYPLLYSYNMNIRYTTLRVPVMFKYSFYRSNSSVLPFFKFGSGIAIYLNQKGVYEYRSGSLQQTSTPDNVYIGSLDTSYDPKPVIPFFIAGAGMDVRFGKRLVSVGAVYEHEGGTLVGYRSNIQIQLGFQF